ncbi:MAG TPA: GAF domain-containing protein [Nitrospiria bacterium]
MDFHFWVLIATSLLNLSLALFITSRGGRKRINISFVFLLMCVVLWTFSVAMFQAAENPEAALFWSRVFYWAAVMIPCAFFDFSRIFPQEITRVTFAQRVLIYGFPMAMAVLMPATGFLVQDIYIRDRVYEVGLDPLHYFIYSAFFIFMMGLAFSHLRLKYMLFDGLQKLQIRYVLIGTFTSTMFGAAFNLILPWFGNYRLIWLGPVFTVIMISCIAYAIVRHRLMDLRVFLKRTIVYSALLVLTLSLYTLIILASQQVFESRVESRAGPYASLIISAFLVAVGFDPLRRLFHRATERIFFQTVKDPQQLLSRLSEILSTIVDMDQLLTSMTRELTEFFETHRTSILVFKNDRLRAAPGPPVFDELDRSHPLLKYYLAEPERKDLLFVDEIRRNIEEGAVVDVAIRRRMAKMEEDGISVILPMHRKDHLIGFLVIGNKKSREGFTAEELQLLEIIAKQASASLDNAYLYEQQKDEAVFLGTLLDLGQRLGSTRGMDELLNTIADFISRYLHADACSVLLREGDQLLVQVTRGQNPKYLRQAREAIGKSIPGWVAQSGEPLLLDSLVSPKPFLEFTEYDKCIYSTICIPLKVRGSVIGVLAVDSFSKEKRFNENDFKIMQLFSSQAAMAIENARMYERAALRASELKTTQ